MPVRLRAARAEEWSFRSICRFGPGDQEASGKLLPIEAIPTNGRATSGSSAVGMTASHLSQPMLASSRTCQHNATVVGRLKKSAREVAQPERQRMLPTDRLSYSAIGERPPLKLPDGARMAVWVIVNVEEWDPTRADATHGADAAAGGRRCRTCRTGRGTNTVTGSASGGSSRCSMRLFNSSRSGDQRLGASRVSSDRASGGRAQVGVHWPRLHPAQHAEGEKRAR